MDLGDDGVLNELLSHGCLENNDSVGPVGQANEPGHVDLLQYARSFRPTDFASEWR
jgi:hypothetical protein